nr:dTDP-4-dehydrorhamnose reductase [Cellulomonas hominis]
MVVGAAGMLGQDVVRVLDEREHEVVGVGRDALDITDQSSVDAVVRGVDVVVNCAAYTAVDRAEEDEGAAFAVNAVGAGLVARATRAAGARLVHVSTDYVFDGCAASPYPETAPLAPHSAYGRTKAAGEWAVRAEAPDHLVVRTAWLYGAGGPCFPRTIARAAAERGHLDVVDDQVGQPTWTADLAGFIERLVSTDAAPGIYHGTSAGETSWFDFARAVVASAGMDPEIVSPTTSLEFVRPAPRPAYSVLAHGAATAAGVQALGDWRERWAAAAASVLAAS